MLNNLDLISHAQKALSEKWGYVWGTFGQVLNTELLNHKISQYPVEVGGRIDFIKRTYLNKRVADCVGLIKSYIWWKGGEPIYDSKTDVSADGMYNSAVVRGPMDTFPNPDILGLLVWKKGHIGIYVGRGMVIEARGTTSGVILSPLKGEGSAGWTHWLRCPFINYIGVGDIKTLQTKLNLFGYNITVDGIYGPQTKGAIAQFQLSNGMVSSGILTDETVNAINNMAERLSTPKRKTYVEIINEYSDGEADRWTNAINTAVKASEAEGNLGDLEIFKFLPQLIEKIGNSKKATS